MATRSPSAHPPAPQEPGSDAGESERELRALVRISAAVAGAVRFEEVLDVAAEEARSILGASTASISRWDREAGVLRTLVNVGDLAPGEERRPENECYPLDQFPRANALLERGQAHVTALGDGEGDPEELRLLATLGKRASLAVPIIHAGVTWGELYATLSFDTPGRFGARELRFTSAVADQIAVAVVRADSFARITRLAFEDPLTGLANRRAFDDRLTGAVDRALADGTDVALVLCDLDALKATNDEHGHAAGDERLIATARALDHAAAPFPRALTARIGGDEFALLLEGVGPREAEHAAEAISEALRAAGALGPTVSSGVAALSLGPRRPAELVRLADAAQYRAKRTGSGRVSTAMSGHMPPSARADGGRRRRRDPAGRERLLVETLARLDVALARATELERLDAVARACTAAAGGTAWAISRLRPDGLIETLLLGEAERPGEQPAQSFALQGDIYPVEDFPASARLLREGGTLVQHSDDPAGDPAERAVLVRLGHTRLLAAGLRGERDPMLVELYASSADAPLEPVAPLLRLLLTHAAHGR